MFWSEKLGGGLKRRFFTNQQLDFVNRTSCWCQGCSLLVPLVPHWSHNDPHIFSPFESSMTESLLMSSKEKQSFLGNNRAEPRFLNLEWGKCDFWNHSGRTHTPTHTTITGTSRTHVSYPQSSLLTFIMDSYSDRAPLLWSCVGSKGVLI